MISDQPERPVQSLGPNEILLLETAAAGLAAQIPRIAGRCRSTPADEAGNTPLHLLAAAWKHQGAQELAAALALARIPGSGRPNGQGLNALSFALAHNLTELAIALSPFAEFRSLEFGNPLSVAWSQLNGPACLALLAGGHPVPSEPFWPCQATLAQAALFGVSPEQALAFVSASCAAELSNACRNPPRPGASKTL